MNVIPMSNRTAAILGLISVLGLYGIHRYETGLEKQKIETVVEWRAYVERRLERDTLAERLPGMRVSGRRDGKYRIIHENGDGVSLYVASDLSLSGLDVEYRFDASGSPMERIDLNSGIARNYRTGTFTLPGGERCIPE